MKRWHWILAIVGAALLGFSAWAMHDAAMTRHTIVVQADGCTTPVTVVEPDTDKPEGSVVVIHGLASSRRVMQTLADDLAFDGGWRVYVMDLPGHGDNTDPFSFARAERCADATLDSLVRSGAIQPAKAAVVGHSMGGAIAIRAADRDPVAATVAISPAPMILPERIPVNLLIVSGSLDPAPLRRQASELEKAAEGNRTDADDFLQARAFLMETIRNGTHTGLLFRPQVEADARDWIENSFEAAAHNDIGVFAWNSRVGWNQENAAANNLTLRGRALLAFEWVGRYGSLLGLIGLLMLFPLAAAIAGKFTGPPRCEIPEAHPGYALLAFEGAVIAMVAVLLLLLFTPLKFLHLYTGDYFASLLMVAGLLLLALNSRYTKASLSFAGGARFSISALLAFAAFLAVGAWLNWQLADLWMNAPRWLRFAALVPLLWIFCYAEEVVLGPSEHGAKRAIRFGMFLLLRFELWLACTFAVYKLASGQVLIPLLVIPLLLFSILQRMGTDSMRRRTGSAAAAALFGAILCAWFVAALFPLS
ncbi:MAG: alpha/beta fold hydrolase [Candidatus Acidiferrales bacterium]